MKRLKIFNILLGGFLFLSIERFCHSQTDGFRLNKAISSHEYPFKYSSQNTSLSLHQPFYYLGKGVQFYAFLGEDGQTILKLFKHHHFGLSTDALKKCVPNFFSKRIIACRERRMGHLFESVRIACEEIPMNTGVFFVHIGKNSSRLGRGIIYDKLGIQHEIDWDKTDFLLQTRAEPVKQHLSRLFQKGQIKEAIAHMTKLIHSIEERSRLGIKNKDGNILENCGFVGDDYPIEIDIGSFVHRTHSVNPDPHSKAGMRARLQLLGWVKRNYPEKLPLCKETLLYEKNF